jgi:hypothetical protein
MLAAIVAGGRAKRPGRAHVQGLNHDRQQEEQAQSSPPIRDSPGCCGPAIHACLKDFTLYSDWIPALHIRLDEEPSACFIQPIHTPNLNASGAGKR